MAINENGNWVHPQTINQKKFTCGHQGCGRQVASNLGWQYTFGNTHEGTLYICPNCHRPTFLDNTYNPSFQIPGVSFGEVVYHLPKDIEELYSEIRKSTSAGSFTASVLACRKILMHIAVEKGAAVGKQFIFYVQYLVDNHYAPPGSKPWVDKIRQSGNEASHEIKIMTSDDAEELINFVEMLLKFIYEFPSKIGIPTITEH